MSADANLGPVRVLALWSPDWPVTAAARAHRIPTHRPAAVVVANRVLACSATARAQGVRRGLRRREAQARCPELVVLAPDAERDARLFEPVVAAVQEVAPGVEVIRPGLVALSARGPVGYFGGEQQAAERLVDQVAARTGVECQIGIADGLFAAVLAARQGVSVEPGGTPAFLAPLGVEELDREPEVDRSGLVSLLRRLGLRSLGAFGSLSASDVASRFGADAVLAHRLARGLDPRPPVRRCPPGELAVEVELDPPVDRVDAAAFAARGLAERLHRVLAGHGLSCTRLGVAAWTEAGDELLRIWRCAEPLTPAGTADRVRWQLDAWLARGGSGALTRVRLVPEETVAAGALQLGLWGEVGETDERAGRALVRVQTLLGPDAVVTAALIGGRDPGERVRLVPWGDDRGAPGPVPSSGPVIAVSEPGAAPVAAAGSEMPIMNDRPSHGPAARGGRGYPTVPQHGRWEGGRRSRSVRSARPAIRDPIPVWPGRLPPPSPATVPPEPLPVELLDATGRPVVLVAADRLGAPPHRIAVLGGPAGAVTGWAGPWPLWQRWWVPGTPSGARLQVLLDDGVALLLSGRPEGWWMTGIYD
ncbi:DNA polymerase Y family protein [Pseudonocardia hispaniensis]|uniref:DNA polymerase Y family protein n=1 Tax=Pseudonocardia hispaniensis TaxID=904933 RepID=A0ABW1IWI7_9PSEU